MRASPPSSQDCKTPPHSLRQLPLRLGLHLDRPAPLRLQLEPRQIPGSGRDDGAAEGRPACSRSPTSSRACSTTIRALRRPKPAASWSPTARPVSRRSRNSGTGLGFHVDFTNPKGRRLVGGRHPQTALLDYGVTPSGTTTTNTRSGTRTRRDGDGRPFRRRSAARRKPLLMHKLAYETAGRAQRRASVPTRSRAAAAPASPATARPGAATTKPPGRRCATT